MFEATTKNGSPVASERVFCHTTVTWLSPGTRKKSGASGANGSRNLLSNTACATSALLRSERGTVVTSSWLIFPSPFASFDDTHPTILSISRIESLGSAVRPTPPVPGFVSKVAPLLTSGVPVPL